MIRFDGQVAIVTGSGRGLGAAYARMLAERGASVVVHDAGVSLDGSGSDPSVADAVVASITAESGKAAPCYENIEAQEGCRNVVETALAQFGRLDILIHNAGWISYTPIEEMTPQLLERILRIQVAAPLWLAQGAFPIMKKQHYGRVVLTTSGRALYAEHALPELCGYAIGKMGQLGLMNALIADGESSGIRVNAISPVAATRMLRRQVGAQELLPEQVAPGVAFLASSQCNRSGVILEASNGHFSITRWNRSNGMDLGIEGVTIEAVAENWEKIASFS